MAPNISGEDEDGPMVATIFVFLVQCESIIDNPSMGPGPPPGAA
jgi:hypothetical protein